MSDTAVVFSTSDIPYLYPDKNYYFDKFEIKPADDHRGYGIFATKDIRQGEIVYFMPTIYVPESIPIVFVVNHNCCVPIQHEKYMTKIKPTNAGSRIYEFTWTDIFINHSCDPNVYYDFSDGYSRHQPDDQIIIAKKDIKSGEELLCDYNDLEEINDNPFDCFCNG